MPHSLQVTHPRRTSEWITNACSVRMPGAGGGAPCPRTAVDWGLQASQLLLHALYWPSFSIDAPPSPKGTSKHTIRFKTPKKPRAYGPTNPSSQTPACSPGATQYSKSHHIRWPHGPPISEHLGFAKCVSLHKRLLPIHLQSPYVVVGALQASEGTEGGFLDASTFLNPSFCLLLIPIL